jgi:hypothetical protein
VSGFSFDKFSKVCYKSLPVVLLLHIINNLVLNKCSSTTNSAIVQPVCAGFFFCVIQGVFRGNRRREGG